MSERTIRYDTGGNVAIALFSVIANHWIGFPVVWWRDVVTFAVGLAICFGLDCLLGRWRRQTS